VKHGEEGVPASGAPAHTAGRRDETCSAFGYPMTRAPRGLAREIVLQRSRLKANPRRFEPSTPPGRGGG
jgi:hypothetical protein